jgi:hypothetical protein
MEQQQQQHDPVDDQPSTSNIKRKSTINLDFTKRKCFSTNCDCPLRHVNKQMEQQQQQEKEKEKEEEEEEEEEVELEINNNTNNISIIENENVVVKYLTENQAECHQLIGEMLKIEQLDLKTIKEHLEHINFNEFLKRCTKNKIFQNKSPAAPVPIVKHHKRASKRADSYSSDIDFIANTRLGEDSALQNTDSNSLLNQKKSLRLKNKNLLFKKLIEREKDDYYDYSIDEEYEPETVSEPTEMNLKKNKVQSTTINAVINGKSLSIDENDYKQFVRCGKWCSLEFFRVSMSGMLILQEFLQVLLKFLCLDGKQDCQFCKRKCKTTIDNVYICVLCRNFAYKTLSKHLAYVCKERFVTPGWLNGYIFIL